MAQRGYVRTWPNQTEITVAGSHYAQEVSPREIGGALAEFVARLRTPDRRSDVSFESTQTEPR
jgi:haloalkane dehalogenase